MFKIPKGHLICFIISFYITFVDNLYIFIELPFRKNIIYISTFTFVNTYTVYELSSTIICTCKFKPIFNRNSSIYKLVFVNHI